MHVLIRQLDNKKQCCIDCSALNISVDRTEKDDWRGKFEVLKADIVVKGQLVSFGDIVDVEVF